MKVGSPEWQATVTASKVAGILGISPWDSPLTTWLRMRGDIPGAETTAAMMRGHYLENGVLDWWLDQGDRSDLARQPQQRLGDWGAATPDMLATDGDERVLVDAKTAADDDHWANDEPPAYYLASSLWQLACFPDIDRVHLAVLFGRPRLSFREYIVHRDDELISSIVTRCREFYDSLASDVEPGLSGMACEYDAIRTAHPDIDKGETAVLDDDLADAYLTAYFAEKDLPAIKARVLDAMGNAQYATTSDGRKIARRQPSAGAVALYCAARRTNQETAA